MEKIHRDLIRRNINSIMNHTEIEILLPVLEQKRVFPKVLIDIYKDYKLEERKRQVFSDIQKRGPKAFALLLEACLETGHQALYRILTNASPEKTKMDSDGQNCVKSQNDEMDERPRTGLKPYFYPGFNPKTDDLENTLCTSSPEAMVSLVTVKKKIEVKFGTELMDVPTNTKHKLPPYPMRGPLRGVVLIINIIEFDANINRPRNGAYIDQECLIELFTQLNFKVYVKENLTYVDMKNRLDELVKDPDLWKADCCFVIIMSHGQAVGSVEGTAIVTQDNGLFSTHTIVSYFNNKACPALQQKPKIFLFQTCRGKLSDMGTQPVNSKTVEADGAGISIKDLEPFMSNVLIGYSSYPGYESYRHPDTGSWFIEQLCEVFMKHAHDTDVQEMLKIMAHEVKMLGSENQRKQTPEIRDILFRPCYLNPGLPRDNKQENEISSE